tara:strand:- start:218 stop:865 length:648 start_codon:yes stop_codon:yes gene_type:complete
MEIITTNYLCNFLNIDQQRSLFNSIFEDINGYEISLNDRKQYGYENDKSYTYGEVSFEGFKEIFEIISLTDSFEFLDLGSGLGKGLIMASLLYPCQKLVGYENLANLATTSKEILTSYVDLIKKDYPAAQLPEFSIVQDSFFNADFSTADVIFASSTCFGSTYIEFINSKIDEMKTGSYLVMLTKQVSSDSLECIYKGTQKMGWGTPTVYIYKRL